MYGNDQRSKLIAFTAVFVALITIGGWISVPILAIPFTLQTLFVLLAAGVMKRYAFLPAALYLLLGTFGLPIFHNGTAGPGILLGPTGGFLAGFLAMAIIAGFFFEKEDLKTDVLGLLFGTLAMYLCALGWYMISTGTQVWAAILVCVAPFIIGDAIKAGIVEVVMLRLRKTGRFSHDSD